MLSTLTAKISSLAGGMEGFLHEGKFSIYLILSFLFQYYVTPNRNLPTSLFSSSNLMKVIILMIGTQNY